MAYIQVFAVVLCSCFVQDVLTAATSPSATGPSATKRAGGRPPATGPVSKWSTVRRTVMGATSSKYPNLAKAEAMMWAALEDVNNGSESGKMVCRDARNVMRGLLTSAEFWDTATDFVEHRALVTSDKRRADRRVDVSNAIARLMTGPSASSDFLTIADDVYRAAGQIHCDESAGALQLATRLVEDGSAAKALQMASTIVSNVRLDPKFVSKGFNMLKKTLNMGGVNNVNQKSFNHILKFATVLDSQQKH